MQGGGRQQGEVEVGEGARGSVWLKLTPAHVGLRGHQLLKAIEAELGSHAKCETVGQAQVIVLKERANRVANLGGDIA